MADIFQEVTKEGHGTFSQRADRWMSTIGSGGVLSLQFSPNGTYLLALHSRCAQIVCMDTYEQHAKLDLGSSLMLLGLT